MCGRASPKPVDVDVRILAASSDKLDRALAEKRLDPDLYYRLSAFTVNVPPLRQRKEEIKILLRYPMHKVAKYYGLPPREFTQSALDACQNHSWPGKFEGIGDLRQTLSDGRRRRTHLGELGSQFRNNENIACAPKAEAAQAEVGGVRHLKSMIQSVRWETERNAIAAALEKTGWNRKAAARLLGVSYRTILYKIEQYEMSAPESYLSSFREPDRLFPARPRETEKQVEHIKHHTNGR